MWFYYTAIIKYDNYNHEHGAPTKGVKLDPWYTSTGPSKFRVYHGQLVIIMNVSTIPRTTTKTLTLNCQPTKSTNSTGLAGQIGGGGTGDKTWPIGIAGFIHVISITSLLFINDPTEYTVISRCQPRADGATHVTLWYLRWLLLHEKHNELPCHRRRRRRASLYNNRINQNPITVVPVNKINAARGAYFWLQVVNANAFAERGFGFRDKSRDIILHYPARTAAPERKTTRVNYTMYYYRFFFFLLYGDYARCDSEEKNTIIRS